MSVPITQVERVKWSSHLRWMRENFRPGQHISVITPTGGGKSHLAVQGLLKLPVLAHARVLLLDDKHTDESTKDFGSPVREYPNAFYPRPRSRAHGLLTGKRQPPVTEHYRLLVPEWSWDPRDTTSSAHARSVVLEAFQKAYKHASPGDGWVLVLDETRSFTDKLPPSLDLAAALKYMWRMGRYKHLTIIALTQMPMGVPGEMFDQPTYLYFGRDADERRIDRFADLGGSLPRGVMRATIPTLGDHEFLFLGRRGRTISVVEVGRE